MVMQGKPREKQQYSQQRQQPPSPSVSAPMIEPTGNALSPLVFLRLSLSGALLGVCVVGLIGPLLGLPAGTLVDCIGAAAGFSVVALAQVAHLI